MTMPWFVSSLTLIVFLSLSVFASKNHNFPSRQTEADLSAEFKQNLFSGFAYQNATLLFHQLDLAGDLQPQATILALIEESQGLIQKTDRMKSDQTFEFKISGLLAKALGLSEDSKTSTNFRMRVSEGREKLQEMLLSLNQMNDMIFQGNIGNPVRSPDSDYQKKLSWMLFQRKLFEISSRLYK